MDPPPYLKTRVLAELGERRSRARGIRAWQMVASASAALGVAAVLWVTTLGDRGSTFAAVTGRPFLVKIEMENLDAHEIAEAEIVLPEGTYFYSESLPEIRAKRSLVVAWNSEVAKGYLPFVIRTDRPGKQVVVVKFRNRNQDLVGERKIRIQFAAPTIRQEG